MRIALITSVKLKKNAQAIANNEDAQLLDFLTAKGLHVISTTWNDKSTDWSNFDGVIMKSPWDYHHHVDDFLAWLDKLNELGIKVFNPIEIIKWNSNKRYLIDLAQKGLPVIPSEYLEKATPFDRRLFDALGRDKLVIKPCISAGAENTLVIDKTNLHGHLDEINQLLAERDCLIQPFVSEVKNGEWSFLFFNGKYSHSVLKTPQSGDFRVQHQHGGTISSPTPDPSLIGQATAYLANLPHPLLYARVDGIVMNNTFNLMELELIEPYLFLQDNHKLMENYFEALMTLILQA